MEIRAAEISKVIKDQIANFGTQAEVSEVGTEDIGAAFAFTERALREGVDLDDFERVLSDYERYAEATGRFSELTATLGSIAPEHLVAGKERQVGIDARGNRVVIAGAIMRVRHQFVAFAAHDDADFGMGFQVKKPIYHMRPGTFQTS